MSTLEAAGAWACLSIVLYGGATWLNAWSTKKLQQLGKRPYAEVRLVGRRRCGR